MLDQSGVATGIALDGVLAASDFLNQHLQTRLNSNRWQVYHAQRSLATA
jgi:hypothetical protein